MLLSNIFTESGFLWGTRRQDGSSELRGARRRECTRGAVGGAKGKEECREPLQEPSGASISDSSLGGRNLGLFNQLSDLAWRAISIYWNRRGSLSCTL